MKLDDRVLYLKNSTTSNLKFIIYPLSFLQPTICTHKDSAPLSFTSLELTFKYISIFIDVLPFTMQIVSYKLSLVCIFICKFEYTNTMFHSATPIAFILCSWQKVIPAIAIDFIIYEATCVFLTRLIDVFSPSTLFAVLHFTLIAVSILIFDAEFTLTEICLLDFCEFIIYFFGIVSMLLRLDFSCIILCYLLLFLLFLLFLNNLNVFLLCLGLSFNVRTHFSLRFFYLKKFTIIDLAIFEKIHSIFMKLFFSDFLPHFEYFSIKVCFSALSQEHF